MSRAPTLRFPAVSRTVRASARRLSWGLGDQAVSSLTNFAVGVVVARSLGAAEFGIFSLAWVTYSVAVNLSRGVGTDPLIVRYSGVSVASWRAAVAKSAGTAITIGLALGAVSAAVGVVIGGSLGTAFLALGIVLPGLLLQDSWRFAFFAAGLGSKAFTADLVWAVALVPALLLAVQLDGVGAFVLAWGAAGALAAVVSGFQARVAPRPSRVRAWLTQQRDLGPRYLIENISTGGAGQLRMYGLGAIAGVVDVGAVRGAELLLGPFLALMTGVSLFAVPEAARLLRRSARSLPIFCVALGGLQSVAALSWGLSLIFLLPDAVGPQLLGDVWQGASVLLLPATLSVTFASFSTGATAGLRALGAAPRSLRAQVVTSSLYVTGGLGGAAIAGALGSSWGCAAATGIGVIAWWWQLRAGLRDHAASGPTDTDIGLASQTTAEEMRTP